jgi:hypothetical protein
MRQNAVFDDIEVIIGPHPSRPRWRVLRVTYESRPDHEGRIASALTAIFGPLAATTSPPIGQECARGTLPV